MVDILYTKLLNLTQLKLSKESELSKAKIIEEMARVEYLNNEDANTQVRDLFIKTTMKEIPELNLVLKLISKEIDKVTKELEEHKQNVRD